MVMLPVGEQPEVLPGEEIRSVTKLHIDDTKPAPCEREDAKGNALSDWLAAELASFHEAMGVVDSYRHECNPDKMSAQDLNKLLLHKRGRGWGKWKDGKGESLQGAAFTTSDFIDQKTLLASYVDHISIHQWYIQFRKKRLKLFIRYAAEPDLTLQTLETMSENVKQEFSETIPKPVALTTQAKIMQKEAEVRPDQLTVLLTKTIEAKEALYAAMADLGETVHGFKKLTDDYSKELHAFKSSVIFDLGAAKREMADVRKFFLEKEHVTEIDRLKEFLDLCDRFKKLKDDGVLDVITDVILKLEGA